MSKRKVYKTIKYKVGSLLKSKTIEDRFIMIVKKHSHEYYDYVATDDLLLTQYVGRATLFSLFTLIEQ